MLKNIFFPLFIALAIFSSCQKQPTEEMAPTALPETWHMKLVIEFTTGTETFELDTEDIGKYVGNYDPSTGQNTILGKTLKFHDRAHNVDVLCWYEFASQSVFRIDGNYHDDSFGNVLNPINQDGTTNLNFCHGPQKVPANLFVVQIQ